MRYIDIVLNKIQKGMNISKEGIPMPFEKLSGIIEEISQKTYYLIGGAAKAGKTALADKLFLYNSFDYYKTQKLKGDSNFDLLIDYYTFEIDIESKILKGVSLKLWQEFGIIIPPKKLGKLRKHENKGEIWELVVSLRDYFEDLDDVCTLYQHPENPTGIHKQLLKRARELGTIVTKNINEDPDGVPINRFDKYVPKNEDLYRFCMVDHVSLVPEEKGYTTKQNIDKLSSYLVMHRNNFSLSPVVIQQLSFETQNDERFKSNRLTPTTRDFSDSRYTIRDCNIALALFNPSELHLDKFQGYQIDKLGNKFRNLEILVHRDGEPNINVGLNFVGEVGDFRELPNPKDMTEGLYYYLKNNENKRSKYIKENGIWKENPLAQTEVQ